jgi:hypothetical protein
VLEATRPPSRRWSRRALVVAVVVTALLGTTAYAVDRAARQREEKALEACGERAAAVVDTAYAPIREQWGRALPALDGGASLMIRFSLYQQLSRSAAGAAEPVAVARDDCASVGVWAVHTDLLARRDECVRALGRHEEFLAAVARTGVTVNSAWPEPLAGC